MVRTDIKELLRVEILRQACADYVKAKSQGGYIKCASTKGLAVSCDEIRRWMLSAPIRELYDVPMEKLLAQLDKLNYRDIKNTDISRLDGTLSKPRRDKMHGEGSYIGIIRGNCWDDEKCKKCIFRNTDIGCCDYYAVTGKRKTGRGETCDSFSPSTTKLEYQQIRCHAYSADVFRRGGGKNRE